MSLQGTTFLSAPGPLAPAPAHFVPQAGAQPGAVPGSGLTALAAGLLSGAAAVAFGQKKARTARRFFGGSQPAKAPKPTGPLALPWMAQPEYRKLSDPLLTTMDAGFDPFGLATSPGTPFGSGEEAYYNFREAELKHGRLAMLATLGWLSAEEFSATIARQLGLPDDLAPGELAPSLSNGGIDNLPPWFLPVIFAISGAVELIPNERGDRILVPGSPLRYKSGTGRVPGDLGFDPLNLRLSLAESGYEFSRLHNAEVKHGRGAMIAVTAFIYQEFVTKIPVISEDEVVADRFVRGLDKAIDNIDRATGAKIPDLPLPFPGL